MEFEFKTKEAYQVFEEKCYMFAVCYCRRHLPAEEILKSIRTTSVLPIEWSKKIMLRLLNDSTTRSLADDDEVAAVYDDEVVVPLNCPSTWERISLPGRGVNCRYEKHSRNGKLMNNSCITGSSISLY